MRIMRLLSIKAFSFLAVSTVLFTAAMESAQAVPAFARQVGQPCTACHYQHFPTLNGFGRMFKSQGYTMVGTQELVEGDGASLPSVLNAAMVGTLSLEDTNKKAKSIGFPRSLSLYYGGRVTANSGFLMEIPFEKAEVAGETASGEEVQGEVHPEGGPSLAQLGSIKWNYVQDLMGYNVGLNAYSSAMAGPAYGYELLSTGAMGMNVPVTGANAMGAIGLHMEHGATLMSAFMDNMSPGMSMIMNMAGKATGVGASVQNSDFFVYYSAYFGAQAMDTVSDPGFAHYLRAVWTPMLAGWDMGVGTQLYRGGWSIGATEYDAVATAFDFQAQGQVGEIPVGIYASYATAPKSSSADKLNWYNFSTGGDNKAFGVLVEAEVMHKLSVNFGYTSATYWMDMKMSGMSGMGGMGGMSGGLSSSSTDGTLTQVGADYLLAPNKRLGFKLASFGGDLDETATVIELMAGF